MSLNPTSPNPALHLTLTAGEGAVDGTSFHAVAQVSFFRSPNFDIVLYHMRSLLRVIVVLLVGFGGTFPCLAAEESKDVVLAKRLIDSFTKGNKGDNWPHIGPMPRWNIEADTYTQEVSSEVIADLYKQACEKIEEHYKAEMKSYTWVDQEGWPRLATVVQFKIDEKPSSFLLISAFQNNDNDSFSFSYEDGEFSMEKKKLVNSWAIPKGHLREGAK